MNKLVLVFLLLITNVAFAGEFFISGNRYYGQPVACSTPNDAKELAELYVNKSMEEFSNALSIKIRESLCFSEITIGYTPLREISTHKGKKTVYVIEVLSGDLFYLVTKQRVLKFKKESIAT